MVFPKKSIIFLSKAGITRSSFLYNLFASIILGLSHVDVTFLKNFLPDGSVWVFRKQIAEAITSIFLYKSVYTVVKEFL